MKRAGRIGDHVERHAIIGRMKTLIALLLSFAALANGAPVAAQAWPSRPIRFVVPYGPGSSPDVLARILVERLAPRLGQPVFDENRVGAGGNLGTGIGAKAAPDGYTFVVSTHGPLVNKTGRYKKVPTEP